MDLRIFDLGLVDYETAYEAQRQVFLQVKAGVFHSAAIACSHYPVITLGRTAREDNILAGESRLMAAGIGIYKTERGGDVTYHGPGQVTIYPVFNLQLFKKDLHWFLRQFEEALIICLRDYGISASRRSGLTGVWINNEKIASIGIAVRNWITFHGLSLNVKKNDLQGFSYIRPCGLDVEMTTMESVLGRDADIETVKKSLLLKIAGIFKINEQPFLAGAAYG